MYSERELNLQGLPCFEFVSSHIFMYLFIAARHAANLYIPSYISYVLHNPSLRGRGEGGG